MTTFAEECLKLIEHNSESDFNASIRLWVRAEILAKRLQRACEALKDYRNFLSNCDSYDVQVLVDSLEAPIGAKE
jgi:hypothetical protein